MPKRRSRRNKRRSRRSRRRRGAGSYGRRDAWDNVARRRWVSTDAAAAARDRAHRLAGRNVDPYRRRDWLKGPSGVGRKMLAEHAARAGRRHQLGLRGALRSGAAGGTRRRRRTRRRRKRRRTRRNR